MRGKTMGIKEGWIKEMGEIKSIVDYELHFKLACSTSKQMLDSTLEYTRRVDSIKACCDRMITMVMIKPDIEKYTRYIEKRKPVFKFPDKDKK
jgi:hypothetical protein